jgi:hypothetical protein
MGPDRTVQRGCDKSAGAGSQNDARSTLSFSTSPSPAPGSSSDEDRDGMIPDLRATQYSAMCNFQWLSMRYMKTRT